MQAWQPVVGGPCWVTTMPRLTLSQWAPSAKGHMWASTPNLPASMRIWPPKCSMCRILRHCTSILEICGLRLLGVGHPICVNIWTLWLARDSRALQWYAQPKHVLLVIDITLELRLACDSWRMPATLALKTVMICHKPPWLWHNYKLWKHISLRRNKSRARSFKLDKNGEQPKRKWKKEAGKAGKCALPDGIQKDIYDTMPFSIRYLKAERLWLSFKLIAYLLCGGIVASYYLCWHESSISRQHFLWFMAVCAMCA